MRKWNPEIVPETPEGMRAVGFVFFVAAVVLVIARALLNA